MSLLLLGSKLAIVIALEAVAIQLAPREAITKMVILLTGIIIIMWFLFMGSIFEQKP